VIHERRILNTSLKGASAGSVIPVTATHVAHCPETVTMKSAECPFGAAAGLRAGRPAPALILPAHVERAMKLLAIAVGFVCGCRLGITWALADVSHAILPIVGKCAFLVAGPVALLRRRSNRDYDVPDGRT
jgi:hypothetical protein